MAISPEIVEALKILGLSEYQAKVYIALIGYGSASASAISTASKVPQNKVYSVLKELEEAGLVFVGGSGKGANIYRPNNPDFFIREMSNKYSQATGAAKDFLIPLFERSAEPHQSKSIWVLRGTPTVYSKLVEMILGSREEVILATDTLYDLKVARVVEAIKNRQKKLSHLQVKVITYAHGIDDKYEKDVLQELTEMEGVEVKLLEREGRLGTIFLVVDGREILQGSYAILSQEIGLGMISTWSDNQNFSALWKEFADYLWKGARELETVLPMGE
ncbi:MAG: TrmB family transcriptional regulator [Promethearchaeota archaeon]